LTLRDYLLTRLDESDVDWLLKHFRLTPDTTCEDLTRPQREILTSMVEGR
jgi:hypothetical protein